MKGFWILFLALILGLLVLSGCAQQQGQPAGGNGATAGDGSAANGAQAGDGSSVQPQGNEHQAANSGFDEFVGLASKRPEYKVSYDQKTIAEGLTIEAKTVVFAKGGKFRSDSDLSNMKTRSWVLPERTVHCITQGAQDKEDCYEAPKSDSQTDLGIDVEKIKNAEAAYTISKLASRTIAGELGSCYKLVYNAVGESPESEYCLASDGILLYSKVSITSAVLEMTATSVGRSVSDADLVPPPISEVISS